MTKPEFIQVLKGIRTAISSSQGKEYGIVSVSSNVLIYTRESGREESISVDELYTVYCKCSYINTTVVRQFISGRKFSPAVAILTYAGLYDGNGRRRDDVPKAEKAIAEKVEAPQEPATDKTDKTDEGLFFEALHAVLGNCVIAKTINRHVSSDEVFLVDDYRKMKLGQAQEASISEVLTKLNSDASFSGKSLTTYIDGFISNHPVLGSRIVEFDEEQHFSPARMLTLQALTDENLKFKSYYSTLLKNTVIYQEFLKKHRLKLQTTGSVPTIGGLLEAINTPEVNVSGYIESKTGFDYKGGRIAQRAYYDLLRDVAHLSSENKSLQPILRFPKVLFETRYKTSFSRLSQQQIVEQIVKMLGDMYGVKIK